MEPELVFSLIGCAKDEGLSIIKWVAHHQTIGFTQILIATNNCSDGTDDLVSELAKFGIVHHLENIVPPNKFPQRSAYDTLIDSEFVKNSDWLMILDLDEFLNVHNGDGSIGALAKSIPENINILALYCALFGDNKLDSWQQGLVTELFTTRLPITQRPHGGTKCLIRNPSMFGQLRNHFPNEFRGDLLRAIDGACREIPIKDHEFNDLPSCRECPIFCV